MASRTVAARRLHGVMPPVPKAIHHDVDESLVQLY